MPKVTRKAPPSYLVFLDTSVLWDVDKSLIVSRRFDEFLSAHESKFTFEFVISNVVRGELLYQQTTSALKALTKAGEELARAASIAQTSYSLSRVDDMRIREDVKNKIDRWLKARRADVEPVPFSSIDWTRLAEDAIWRRPPFVEDSKNSDQEKGFRDTLILETLYAACKKKTGVAGAHIAFLCHDKLLRSTAEQVLNSYQNFSAYESVDHLASYLKLTQEKLTEEFIKGIQGHAIEKFYSATDPTCLVKRERIIEKIRTKFVTNFAPPSTFPSLLGATQLLTTTTPWQPYGDEQIWLTGALFEKLVGSREFHWKTVIAFVQPFKYTGVRFLTPEKPKIRILRFRVLWKANVKTDGRFHDMAVEAIELDESRFEEPTPEDIKRFLLTELETSQKAETSISST